MVRHMLTQPPVVLVKYQSAHTAQTSVYASYLGRRWKMVKMNGGMHACVIDQREFFFGICIVWNEVIWVFNVPTGHTVICNEFNCLELKLMTCVFRSSPEIFTIYTVPRTSSNICMSTPERQNTLYRFIEPTLQQHKHETSGSFTNRQTKKPELSEMTFCANVFSLCVFAVDVCQ